MKMRESRIHWNRTLLCNNDFYWSAPTALGHDGILVRKSHQIFKFFLFGSFSEFTEFIAKKMP